MLVVLTLSDAANECLPAFLEAFCVGARTLGPLHAHSSLIWTPRTACAAGTPLAEDSAWLSATCVSAASVGGPPAHVPCSRHKQRFSLLRADATGPLLPCLEAIKAADLMVVLLPWQALSSDSDAVSPSAAAALPALRAQGLPPLLGALFGLDSPSAPAAPKAKAALRKCGEDIVQAALSVAQPRILPVHSGADAAEFARQLASVRLAPPLWRTLRPYLIAEEISFLPSAESPDAPGTLLVTGYVRGAAMSADQLACLPGCGQDFQFASIEAAPAPREVPRHARAAAIDGMDVEGGADGDAVTLSVPGDEQESLQRENVADPLSGEQTWPTQEEMADAGAAAKAASGCMAVSKRMQRRPKGWSDYQAAWIREDEEQDEESASDLESLPEDDVGAAGDGGGDDAQMADGGCDGAKDVASEGEDDSDDDFLGEDEQTQEQALEAARHDSERRLALRRSAESAEAEQSEFPDEVDVPYGSRASARFARYRGLKSFRASAWDPYESLPGDYSRIFSFQNFARTRRRALAGPPASVPSAAAQLVAPGTRVCARLACVPPSAAAALLQRASAQPAVLLGLLQHEAKLSVLHCALTKASAYAQPLASKAPLVLHAGFRVIPSPSVLFSHDGNGDKFKYQRFLPPSAQCVGTTFGPITYGPAPVLAFDDAGQLAATGTLRPVDPERVVLKRAIITGYPHKVHKKKAVVRFMFHCPEDVRWFRPLELWTKYGRHGKIREPIGTHGSMKCAFDGPLQQRDTVCASLYKRVFPKLQAGAAPMQ